MTKKEKRKLIEIISKIPKKRGVSLTRITTIILSWCVSELNIKKEDIEKELSGCSYENQILDDWNKLLKN